MITKLTIKNYALIEDITISFNQGLTVITGETGAGKSILLDAISLILGKRADLSSVKDTSKKCIIEAEFNTAAYALQTIFQEADIDYEEHTIIRREILPSGKSRAFINDSPVTLQVLDTIGKHLIDIHNQHQTLSVATEDFQFQLIDYLGNNISLVKNYQKELLLYKELKRKLEELNLAKVDAQKELDYNTFLLNELVEANLKSGEQETLEAEYETLSNVEIIQEKLSEINILSTTEQIGIIHSLREVQQKLNKLKEHSSLFESLFERIKSVLIEFEDIQDTLNDFSEKIDADPQRLSEINDKLQLVHKLLTKHQAISVEELLEIQKTLNIKVSQTIEMDETISKLQSAILSKESELKTHTAQIHNNRKQIIPSLTSQLEDLSSQLGLPNAKFKIELTDTKNFNKNGTDNLQFLFTANKGVAFGEIKKIASGGEMGRIMLAFKNILAKYTNLPTIIFDEIDTGVSGEIANQMGKIMQKMSAKMQVLSITHLPQIAAKGTTHLKVYKEDINEVTQTRLVLLNTDQRIVELAQMLGGEKKSASALAHAKELLN